MPKFQSTAIASLGALVSTLSLATELPSMSAPDLKGRISVSVKDSVAAWPELPTPPAGAPNIVLIMLDDIGFADSSTFGGIANTPALDQLAARGLRYNNFHTTGTCSPTRAALLAGRNHHRMGFGFPEVAGGFPGYNFTWGKDTVSFAEVLRRHGYSTSMFGKWHNTPYRDVSAVGPFDRWPSSLGFEYFYGIMAGADNQWEPLLYRNTTAIEPPSSPERGYHLTADLVAEAIRWLQTQKSLAPEKPFFLYFAPAAVHEPHHAPREWIDQYRGRFDAGWDKLRQDIFSRQKRLGVVPATAELTPRPPEIPAWNSLSPDQQRLYSRQMEVYAGFVSHTDHEIGRLLKVLDQRADRDNTLILYIVGDNGSAGDYGLNGGAGGVKTVLEQLKLVDELGSHHVTGNSYSAGWGWLGSTPFKWWKGVASHLGGIRNPLVVSWPVRIKDRGGLRNQFTHVNGVAATLYEATGIPFPTMVDGVRQEPLDGASFADTLNLPNAASRQVTQYFEMWGNRAIYNNGWIASAKHLAPGFIGHPLNLDYDSDDWELYHLDHDFSQAHDLAKLFPERLKELRKLFDAEARKNDVYPLGGSLVGLSKGNFIEGVPLLTDNRTTFTYYEGMPRLQWMAAPDFAKGSYRISAQVVIPKEGAQGLILSYGGHDDGFVLYVKDGRFIYEGVRSGRREVITSGPVAIGESQLVFEYAHGEDAALGRLFVNGRWAGQAAVPTVSDFGWGRSMSIGRAAGSRISASFDAPFGFTGRLKEVTVELIPASSTQ